MLGRRVVLPPGRRTSPFEALGTFAVVAALLYFGAGIIVPLVLATLLAFALTPLVTWLNRRLHLPDPVAVVLAVLVAILILATLAGITGLQVARLGQQMPAYQETVTTKLHGLQEQFGGGAVLERINETVTDLTEQLSASGSPEAPVEGRPVPVVVSNDSGPFSLLSSVLGSIVGPVATVAIVIVVLIFLLLGRADLLDRFIRLVGSSDYAKANIAIADASKRVGRYLLVQLAVNCTYGFLFGLGLWLIGVPSAVLWGLLIVVFRYIPFVGALIIAIVPIFLAFAVDPGWNMLILSIGLFMVLDLTTANVIEPRLYGSSTGVSPIAILLSAMFWATLWGPVGLILATPMTVCLVVIGRHLPQFRFLETLLGSEPVLTPPEQFYQRLLKGNTQSAVETMEDYVDQHGKSAFIGDVAMPALRLASAELTDRPEALEQRRQLTDSLEIVLEELDEADAPEGRLVLLVGGRSEMDEAAARLLALQLCEKGVPTKVLPPLAITPEALGRLELDGVSAVAMVFLGADFRSHARYVSRRLRASAPGLSLVVCALGEQPDGLTADKLHLDAIYRSDGEAIRELEQAWQAGTIDRPDSVRSASSRTTMADDALISAELEKIAGEFDVPVASLNLLDDERHMADADAHQLTEIIATSAEPLVVTAKSEDPRFAKNSYLQFNGIHLYAGVPLILPTGEVIGALALLDYEEHAFGPEAVTQLQHRAASLVTKFAEHARVTPQPS